MSKLMLQGWEINSIKDLGETITGTTPSTTNLEYWGDDIPFISPSDFTNKVYIDNTKRKLSLVGAKKARLLPKDSILVTCIGSLGGIVMNPKISVTNQQINALIPNVNNNARFCFYAILYNVDKLLKYAGSTTIPIINKSNFEKINILIPPKNEQKKIATILTSVDTVIEKTEAQIEKLQLLKKGMMQELLTKGIGHTEFKDSPVGRIPKMWEVIDFENLFVFKNGVNKDKEFFGKGVPIISYKNIYYGRGIIDSDIIGKVDLTSSEVNRFKVKFGDLFFTRTSETPDEIGLSNVYLGSLENVAFSGFVIRARPKIKNLSANFCKYAFSSFSIRSQMIKSCKYTTRAGISSESLSKITLAIPSLQEQEKIANIISSIDSDIEIKMKKNKINNYIKKALMQDLLTGKVRVKVD